MLLNRKKYFLAGADRRILPAALIFLALATFSALVHAATRAVEGLEFDAVVVWGSVEVEIAQGDEMHLRMRGSEDDLDAAPFHVRDGVLHLGRTLGNQRLDNNVKFILKAKDLHKIALKGSGEIFVKPLEVESLEISVEGSGEIMLFKVTTGELELMVAGSGSIHIAEVEATDMEVDVSGSGTVEFGSLKADKLEANLNGSGDVLATKDGAVNKLQVNVVGSGDVELARIRAADVSVNIMGSGDTEVWAENSLSVSVMGSGDVGYLGDPELSSTILGSGDVERLD